MSDMAAGWRSNMRQGAFLGAFALVPIAVLVPSAMRLSGGFDTPRSGAFCVLLLEVAYLLLTSVFLGIFFSGARGLVAAACVPALVSVSLLAAMVLAGADPYRILAAQPAAFGTIILGIGAGRASWHLCRRFSAAASFAFLLVLVLSGNLLVVSHLAPYLSDHPWASEVLLSLNPFIVVTSGGGYDLVRMGGLYDALTLSGYRFQYPRPLLGPILIAAVGFALGSLTFIHFPPVSRR